MAPSSISRRSGAVVVLVDIWINEIIFLKLNFRALSSSSLLDPETKMEKLVAYIIMRYFFFTPTLLKALFVASTSLCGLFAVRVIPYLLGITWYPILLLSLSLFDKL